MPLSADFPGVVVPISHLRKSAAALLNESDSDEFRNIVSDTKNQQVVTQDCTNSTFKQSQRLSNTNTSTSSSSLNLGISLLRCYLCGSQTQGHNHTVTDAYSQTTTQITSSSAAGNTTLCHSCLTQKAKVQAQKIFSNSSNKDSCTIKFCKTCNRYADTNAKAGTLTWRMCEWESRELLALCLNSLGNGSLDGGGSGQGSTTLTKNDITDAHFLYTEPHSRRIKVKLTANQKIVGATVGLDKQNHVVEFVLKSQQCPDCAREHTPHTWSCLVQIRQHKPFSQQTSRRVFSKLENLLLKKCEKNIVGKLVKAEIQEDHADFYFKHKMHASEFEHFIRKHFVVNIKNASRGYSKSLISHDIRNAKYNFKYTRCLDLAPIVRYDLCVINDMKALLSHTVKIKDSGSLQKAAVLLCTECAEGKLEFVDTISGNHFLLHDWKGLKTIGDRTTMKQFTVLDLEHDSESQFNDEIISESKPHPCTADLSRSTDLGTTDDGNVATNVRVSHLRPLTDLSNLEVSDVVWGYDLRCINRPELDCLLEERPNLKSKLPEIVVAFRGKVQDGGLVNGIGAQGGLNGRNKKEKEPTLENEKKMIKATKGKTQKTTGGGRQYRRNKKSSDDCTSSVMSSTSRRNSFAENLDASVTNSDDHTNEANDIDLAKNDKENQNQNKDLATINEEKVADGSNQNQEDEHEDDDIAIVWDIKDLEGDDGDYDF